MLITRRDMMLGGLGATLILPGRAGAGSSTVGGPAFGSSWRATVREKSDHETVIRVVRAIVAEVDALFSPYRADSELSRLNTSGVTDWQDVAPEFMAVAREALEVARLTEGFFDPTVGPLVSRFGFGPISGGVASYQEIELAGSRLRKARPEVTLDFCGIAKGHALDLAVIALQRTGCGPAIIDIGGEIKATTEDADGRPWAVAIADPTLPGAARRIVAPRGWALATSGHAANGVLGRVQISHIIDTRQMKPAEQTLRSVSVLNRSAAQADALATALCAAGPEAGPALARRLGIQACFIFEDAEVFTGGFEDFLLT